MDGTGRESTNQEESRAVGYVQNAEQNSVTTLWKRLKDIK